MRPYPILYAIAFLALLTNTQTFAQTRTDVDAFTGATYGSGSTLEKEDHDGSYPGRLRRGRIYLEHVQ